MTWSLVPRSTILPRYMTRISDAKWRAGRQIVRDVQHREIPLGAQAVQEG